MTNIAFDFPYDVIISHGHGCNDGLAAAWCVWRQLPLEYRNILAKEGGRYRKISNKPVTSNNQILSEGWMNKSTPVYNFGVKFVHPNSFEGAMKLLERGFPVVFIFAHHNEMIPEQIVTNRRILILDLDLSDSLLPLVAKAKSVMLCDHHDSTILTLNKYHDQLYQYRDKFSTFVNVSKSESGATLAWKLFNSTNIPPLIEIVRIGDNWAWEDQPNLEAKKILMTLRVERTFRSFYDFEQTFVHFDKNFDKYVLDGGTLANYEIGLAKQIAKQFDIGFIQTIDNKIYTVAYALANVLHSEAGSLLKYYAQKRFKSVHFHFCATWKYASHRGEVFISLRDADPDINLAEIARTIKDNNGKGGGHVSAAGFRFYGLENFHKYILKALPLNLVN